ncbi:putative Band 7 domain, Flotillin family [Rosa chinensis]|uniref:Flotillin-like n=1 Tax=Rosa chinensis TaxID=74649 RepID=A0A2P6QZ54_ROSCH|nr:putative Band 7 domain, Flotillin family [Rosa chinensis]
MTEKLKADFLSKGTVEYETKLAFVLIIDIYIFTEVQEANWGLYKTTSNKKRRKQFFTGGRKKRTPKKQWQRQNSMYASKQEADGEFYAKKKEAEGLIALGQAQGGLCRLPKISIWTNGVEGVDGGGNNEKAAVKEVTGVSKMLPPLFKTVHEQTGVLPPSWMDIMCFPCWYKVVDASEYLVITGAWIDDLKVKKKAWILPGQTYTIIDLSPVNYTFNVQAMSAEKLPFMLPAVFTIGPRIDDMDSVKKYAKLLSNHDKNSNHVKELVQGVIEGETRVLAASMTMEEVFKGTKEFKKEVWDKVQLELNQFGLIIYNANVKQLVDVQGYEYFSYLGQKTQMEAANQAKVDVAEARMKGEVGAKLREGQTLQNAAKINAETKIISTQREGEGKKEEIRVKTEVKVYGNQKEAEVAQANAELAMKKAGWTKEAQVAEVESTKAVALREAELQKKVETMNAQTTTEKLKAELLSKASVEAETKAREAEWNLYQKQKAADAILYQKKKEAEATETAAQAQLFARQKAADGEFYAKKKEADGLVALGQAHGAYLHTLLEANGGDYQAARDYMMINGGMFSAIARINADAVKGLQPRISIWTNGGEAADGGAGAGNAAMKEIAGLYKTLPPLLQTVQDQTGMQPPSWMGTFSVEDSQRRN